MPEINVPCLPGDKVYILLKHISGVYDIFETTVSKVNFLAVSDKSYAKIDVRFPYDAFSDQLSYQLEDIGKKLFLTLEDAEEKLNSFGWTYPKRRRRSEQCPKE